jgi:hypothetical protein
MSRWSNPPRNTRAAARSSRVAESAYRYSKE